MENVFLELYGIVVLCKECGLVGVYRISLVVCCYGNCGGLWVGGIFGGY